MHKCWFRLRSTNGRCRSLSGVEAIFLLEENCDSEEEYILESENLINEMNEMSGEELEDLFFGETIDKVKLKKVLVKIKININKVKLIPEKEGKFDW